MAINPPTPENFGAVNVTPAVEEATTVEHPSAVYLPDLQAVQLEAFVASKEGRSPNFSQFPENAVRAAGYDPETDEPLGAPKVVQDLGITHEQPPIFNSSGQVNARVEPTMPADGEYDPVNDEAQAEAVVEETETEVVVEETPSILDSLPPVNLPDKKDENA